MPARARVPYRFARVTPTAVRFKSEPTSEVVACGCIPNIRLVRDGDLAAAGVDFVDRQQLYLSFAGLTRESMGKAGVLRANMDYRVKPGNDKKSKARMQYMPENLNRTAVGQARA